MTEHLPQPTADLPPPRRLPYRIGLVCLGNICRSPIAQVVLTHRIQQAGLGDLVEVESAGTGDWHVGDPMDRRAAAVLATSGYDGSAHRARQLTAAWFDSHDLLLVMDQANLREVLDAAPEEEAASRVRMFRDFDPLASEHDREVPDPYYGGDDGFGLVLALVERTAEELTEQLADALRAQQRPE